MKEKTPISYIFLWIGLIILVIIILWRLFGSSPSLDQISLAVATFGIFLAWYGLRAANDSARKINAIYERIVLQK